MTRHLKMLNFVSAMRTLLCRIAFFMVTLTQQNSFVFSNMSSLKVPKMHSDKKLYTFSSPWNRKFIWEHVTIHHINVKIFVPELLPPIFSLLLQKKFSLLKIHRKWKLFHFDRKKSREKLKHYFFWRSILFSYVLFLKDSEWILFFLFVFFVYIMHRLISRKECTCTL